MSTDFDALLLAPLHAELGVSAILTLDGAAHAITVVDLTEGTEINRGGLALPDIKPAALVRAAVIAGLGIEAADLHDQTITINGVAWTIKNTHPKPGPEGRASGEWFLILKDDNL